MEVDWDLHAVVRACCSASSSTSAAPTTAATATTTACAGAGAASSWSENFIGFFPDPFRARNDNSIEQFLNDLNKPLQFPKVQKPPQCSESLPISPLSVIGGLQDLPISHHHQHRQEQQQKQLQGKQQSFCVSRCTSSTAQSTRSKKRKNQMKRVCQVPAEGLSSDVWSWRKYGQKPIKGSPYPRGYYRCSTSKGCLARKQVERNRSDPDMFILTYTGEHSHPVPTHRNSLAGSTRTKPTTSTSGDDDTTKTKPTSSPPISPTTTQSPATVKAEDNDTDDDNFDTVTDDNFFEGLDDLIGPGDNSAVIPATFPWLSTIGATTSTTAAGGS